MDRFRCLPTVSAQFAVPVDDELLDQGGDWIPSQQDVIEVYRKLLRISWEANVSTSVHDVIPTSRKIGQRTFIEGCFDGILLLACWTGNLPVVSYLLMRYMQYFSIDTLIDRLSNRFAHLPTSYGSKVQARFKQLQCDKVSLLHAAAEGLKVDVIKLLLSAGANVNNQSSWSITPLISVFLRKYHRPSRATTLACLIDSGANVNYRYSDGLTPLMYAT